VILYAIITLNVTFLWLPLIWLVPLWTLWRFAGLSRWWVVASLLEGVFVPLLSLYRMAYGTWPQAKTIAVAQRLRKNTWIQTQRQARESGQFERLCDDLKAAGFFEFEEDEANAQLEADILQDGARAFYRSQRVHILDPEDMAEGGLGRALLALGTAAERRGVNLRDFRQDLDGEDYTLVFNGKTYKVCSRQDLREERDTWGLAVVTLCEMVNDNLHRSCRDLLHFWGGGNDGFFAFLPPGTAEWFRVDGTRPSDWPFVPRRDLPGFGQPGVAA
jgi:hypothetical protein